MSVIRFFGGRGWGAWLLAPLLLAGCDECWETPCCGDGWDADDEAPAIPVGLTPVTGDGEVFLHWYPCQDEDLAGYRVYVSSEADGRYDSIGETEATRFVDHGARNGRTYFYAVTAYDFCGNESDLSREIIHDTPRPEGHGLVLANAAAGRPSDSGYDFSGYRRQGPDVPGTDIYYLAQGPAAHVMAASPLAGIQDAGYLALEDLDWAPGGGWSESGRVEALVGHTYAVRTADGYYAKFHVVSVAGDRLTLDWAFQADRGNRELSVGAPVMVAGQSPPAAPAVDRVSGRAAPAPVGGTTR